MKNKIVIMLLSGIFLISGCNSTAKPKEQVYSCKQENVLAPKWTCIPDVDGYYAGVGISQKSLAGMSFMRKIALSNGRSELAQQIQTQIKDKIENFTRSTGNGKNEVVDHVATVVTKQVAKVSLSQSKAVDSWQSPSGTLYLLVTVPKKVVDSEIKDRIKTSFKNDEALWQQFKSKEALQKLEKEFPSN